MSEPPRDPPMITAGLGWLPASWALAIAAVLLVVDSVERRARRSPATTLLAYREVSLILVLYAAWQYAGALSLGGLDGAYRAGLWLAEVEKSLGWPTEAAIQRPVLSHEWLVHAADSYYAGAHVPVMVATLAWVLVWHRREWPFVRTTIVLVTGACLLVQYKPVAPPRLLPELGVVDTALRSGLSVYGPVAGGSQFSAMPSVHLAWAAAVALFVVVAATTPWRWLAIAYPLVTLWVIVITGNHFIIDGVVSVILLGAAAGIAMLFPSQRPSRFPRGSQPESQPRESEFA